jgi:hypothetical protein
VYGNLLEDGYDRNRNVERILLTNAPEGKYVIRVKAYNITCGRRQPYAVVFRASDSISESEMQLAASPLNMHLLERAEPISCGEGRYPIVPLFKSKIWIFGFSPTHTTLTASGLMLSMQNPPVGIPSPLSYNDVFTELITKQTLIAESADDGDQNSLTLFTILGILPGGASPSLGYHFMNPIGVGLPPGVYDEAVNYPDANWWIKAINA